METLLHRLCLVTLGLQTIGGLGGAGFYAYIVWSLSAGKTQLGLDGLVVAGAFMMGIACLGLVGITVGVMIVVARRYRFWRVLAPLPALAATTGFGTWLASGDPGDEHWLKTVVAVEACALVLTLAASVAQPKPPASTIE